MGAGCGFSRSPKSAPEECAFVCIPHSSHSSHSSCISDQYKSIFVILLAAETDQRAEECEECGFPEVQQEPALFGAGPRETANASIQLEDVRNLAVRTRKPYRYPASASQYIGGKARCRVCGAATKVLRYDALMVPCDPVHLSQTGELGALLLRLRTWHVVEPHVYRRHSVAIADEPFPKIGYVLREHRCGLTAPEGAALAPEPPRYASDDPGF